MIKLTRFNGLWFYLNAELVRTVESTPDTVITLSNGEKILVKENPEDVVRKIILYKRLVTNPDLEIELGD